MSQKSIDVQPKYIMLMQLPAAVPHSDKHSRAPSDRSFYERPMEPLPTVGTFSMFPPTDVT